jgi:hypothetical protein
MKKEKRFTKNAVLRRLRKSEIEPPPPTRIIDYPASMSMYEKESLAAEAILAIDRKRNKQPKTTRTK